MIGNTTSSSNRGGNVILIMTNAGICRESRKVQSYIQLPTIKSQKLAEYKIGLGPRPPRAGYVFLLRVRVTEIYLLLLIMEKEHRGRIFI